MKKNIKKMTKNNERSDYIFCHPRECGDPGLNSKSLRLDSSLRWNDNSAFTVLFAVIVSSLILALGLGIVAITMKEVKLSGAGRDSQLAFYSADSGLECAMYWDLRGDFFATSSDSSVQTVTCNKLATTTTILSPEANSATSTFKMCMGTKSVAGVDACDDTKPCALISVSKVTDNGTTTTAIDSRGYNSCDVNNQRRLERGYRVVY